MNVECKQNKIEIKDGYEGNRDTEKDTRYRKAKTEERRKGSDVRSLSKEKYPRMHNRR